MELLIGCGSRRDRQIIPPERPEEWTKLWLCDFNPRHEQATDERFDVVDLEKTPWPYDDNYFDEVHAYEVLEHLGRQGDFKAFFAQFYEIWRILKPGGYLCGTSPSATSQWLWGDPGHTRAITNESFTFLDQREYALQVDKAETAMSDYRPWWRGDFRRVQVRAINGGPLIYVLQANKQEV